VEAYETTTSFLLRHLGQDLNFRLGLKRRYPKKLFVKLGESKADVAKLIGRKVVLEDSHSNKGVAV
jgi:ribosomal protein L35AE/L33A